jgi:hypothetical protein
MAREAVPTPTPSLFQHPDDLLDGKCLFFIGKILRPFQAQFLPKTNLLMVQNSGVDYRPMPIMVPAVPERKGFGYHISHSSVYKPGSSDYLPLHRA